MLLLLVVLNELSLSNFFGSSSCVLGQSMSDLSVDDFDTLVGSLNSAALDGSVIALLYASTFEENEADELK